MFKKVTGDEDMMVETYFKVAYEDCIGDDFDEKESKKVIAELIEEHLKEYCREHKLERSCLKITGVV